MDHFPKDLRTKLEGRKESNAFRSLSNNKKLIDFSSNDYLGWSRCDALYNRASELVKSYGLPLNGATGSRLLTGNFELYQETEREIAEFHSSEAALIFNSGYDANMGVLGSLPQRGDVIFYDEFSHASIRDGVRLSAAASYKFKHNDLEDLEAMVQRNRSLEGTNYVVTESVFSMDGDSPDMNELGDLCKREQLYLIVDEAHALGFMGPKGEGKARFEDPEIPLMARVVTFGKAMGGHGAAVVGGTELIDFLINFARSFIYTTGLPPHSVAGIKAAYERLRSGVDYSSLNRNIAILQTALIRHRMTDYFIPSSSPINSCVVPGNTIVRSISANLRDNGYDVRPILSPTVPAGSERLRICLHSFNTKKEIDGMMAVLADSIGKLGA